MQTSIPFRPLGIVLGAALMTTAFSPATLADSAVFKANPPPVFGPSIPVDSPTFCFGLNDLDQCVMYYGSASSCENVRSCDNGTTDTGRIKKAVADIAIGQRDLTFCYGKDDVTGQCTLFLGTSEQCEHVDPCSVGFKELKLTSKPGR